MSQAGIINVAGGGGGGSPIEAINVQTGITPVVPTANTITFNGSTVAPGIHPVRTDGTALSTMALEVQISQAIASTNATNVGLSAFNSADFTVDANGFVSLVGTGGAPIQTITGNSGGAEVPLAGNFNIMGTGSITVAGSANTETVQLTGLTLNAIQVGAGTATLTQLPVVNNAVLTTGTTGIPIETPLAFNGQLIIGSSSGAPIAATLTAGPGITITNAANSITIAANDSAFAYTNVTHAQSPYTVLAGDEYISVDCSGGVVSLLFPNAPTALRTWVVKDRTGNASINHISITTVGGIVTIDGQTTYTLSGNYGAVQMLANSTPTYEVY